MKFMKPMTPYMQIKHWSLASVWDIFFTTRFSDNLCKTIASSKLKLVAGHVEGVQDEARQ